MTTSPPPTEPVLPPTDTRPASTSSTARDSVDRATQITEELIDRGAPWSSRTSWSIVLVEGIVVAVLGLIFLFKPLGGSSTTLQLVGLLLLGGSLVAAFQLWRHRVRPDLEQLSAFRAGSGVTVGLVVVMATLLTDVTGTVTAALAVVVGIGFIVFGLTGIAGSFVRRAAVSPLPLASLILNAVMALTGAVLMFAGAAGGDAVDGMFVLLGALLIAVGLGLALYSYRLRQEEMPGS